jgi:hypothetical protein
MSDLEWIAATLEEMRKEIAELRRREVEVAREAALEAQLKRIVEAMQPIGARLVVDARGTGSIEALDADGDLIWWHVFPFPYGLLAINPAKWPNFQELVQRWECARPTPRAGNYRDRSTWTYPGRLIATEWNGRKPGREWDM